MADIFSVGNLVHAAFVGDFFAIPLVSNGGGPDSYTEASLADTLGNLFAYVFLDLDTAQSYKLRVLGTRQTQRLGEVMQKVVAGIKSQHFPSLAQLLHPDDTLSSYGPRFVGRLLDSGGTVDDIVWTIIPTAAAASATQAQGVCYDFFVANHVLFYPSLF